MEEKKKICPFRGDKDCDDSCALYISPEELNETVVNKLKSIGVLHKEGLCSLKNLALAESRKIYETSGRVR